MSRFFFNDRKQLVNDAIEGLVISAPHGNLVRLDIDSYCGPRRLG